MTHARLCLTDRNVLRGLMTWAPAGGSLDIRKLADAVGVSKSKIGALLSGERPSVTEDVAERICEVLDVRRDALFYDPLPTPMGVGSHSEEGARRHEHERAIAADEVRGSHELGEHARP
ncbi:helix-turn-helix domain-containing protein [Streptomyces sp. NBC_00582]|uniref:helix-turn-helix domain-containing protein n=1 Tax=Streptomyces sp. NBC_00582 TaxID=2975783 RepID=UPI002E806E56|nr:helix-turn-helix transcriptional regulator [Streptomyces sp. NBC_00582]WUB64659.1 helix-turn-helix domain-containing protein [Streptomyces sp. NBC_00582]